MKYRPGWCPEAESQPVSGFDERICVGRLRELREHDDLFNSGCFCLKGMDAVREINTADAYYIAAALVEFIGDALARGDYNPCPELGIDDPLERLLIRIEVIKQRLAEKRGEV